MPRICRAVSAGAWRPVPHRPSGLPSSPTRNTRPRLRLCRARCGRGVGCEWKLERALQNFVYTPGGARSTDRTTKDNHTSRGWCAKTLRGPQTRNAPNPRAARYGSSALTAATSARGAGPEEHKRVLHLAPVHPTLWHCSPTAFHVRVAVAMEAPPCRREHWLRIGAALRLSAAATVSSAASSAAQAAG